MDFIDIYILEKELKRIENLLELARKDISNAPKGRLRIAHSHGTEQYYHVTDDSDINGKYIRKKNSDVAHLLAQKDYACRMIACLEEKKKCFENLLCDINQYDDEKIYEEFSENRKKLIYPYYISDMEYVVNWLAEPYEAKEIQEELPEITLLDIDRRENVILEHFGMMDNSTYCENAIRKMNTYQNNGYQLGDNILYTFETYRNPINMKNFENMIRNKIHLS